MRNVKMPEIDVNTPRRASSRDRGFTLIEIMAVVLIMGLLMAVVGVNIKAQIDKARLATAKAQISQIESALEFYRMDNGRYPTSAQGLDSLVHKPSGTPEPRNYPPGGYLKKSDALLDPWGVPFEYASPGTNNPHSFDLWSNGADQAPGGEEGDADIGNWDADRSGGG
jgi:general secretion pathway protein G